MRAVLRPKDIRRLATGIFALVLLLCQSIAVANACLATAEMTAAGSACHDPGSEGDAAHPPCDSSLTSIGQVTVPPLELDALAALKVPADERSVAGSCTPITGKASAQPPPVPLTLVHCRLLN